MHSSTALQMDAFQIEVDGRPGGAEDVWPGFDGHDRVGVVPASHSMRSARAASWRCR